MRADRLDRIAAAEQDHFWFEARRNVVIDEVTRRRPDHRNVRMLDVGCGTGSMLDAIGANASSVGLDPLGHHLPQRARGPRFGRARTEALPVRSETIDLILALDVLEHVDDRLAIREFTRCLKPGGVFIGTVPAGPRLWSYRDDDAGHLRRYRRVDLRATVSSGGLIVEQCRAFQGVLMPLL
ncbi:MAG: class I SAM-dependent methyltransferase, partial [Acidimicrobiales bacterium]|nr:class I SAM-dependent methyltransferase [Acidimicrobiales bacterium]